jgi:hypothetical protein
MECSAINQQIAFFSGGAQRANMIDWLRTGKSANFHAKAKRLSKNAIADLFRTIRQNSEAPSNNIFTHVKEPLGHATWSALAFLYERDPSFLDSPDGDVKENICGYVLLVEYRDHVAVFKSNLDLPSEFKTEYFQRIGDGRVEAAIARVDATFEQIRLRNMATSKHALRNKTLEANDLRSVVGPAGSSRYVPRSYRVRRSGDHYTATPDSGKISMRSDRTGYEELVRWTVSVIDSLIDLNAAPSPFIRTFARPIDLGSIPPTAAPTHFVIDVAVLVEELFEPPEVMQFVRGTGQAAVSLNKAETDNILTALEPALLIRKVRKDLRVVDAQNGAQIGLVNIAKTRISLKRLGLPEIENIYVKLASQPAGGDDNGNPLKRYIDQNNLFTILFSDPQIVYLGGELYRDDSLVDGNAFLAHISSVPQLTLATSEKGTFAPAQTTFDADSVFGVLANHIAANDEVLVCDDLGDEWADFIGINGNHQPKTITFYHAKHGALSLGARSLHIVVSQAIKNLSRTNLPADEVASKFGKWTSAYENEGVDTMIPHIVRGSEATLRAKITEALSAPDTIRRVYIVTSSLSRAQLEHTFADLRAGEAPEPHFVQLYQLLMSYFSACTEVGAYAYLVCQE